MRARVALLERSENAPDGTAYVLALTDKHGIDSWWPDLVVVFRIAVAVCGNEPASLAPRFSLGAWLVLARDGWQIFLRPADAMARRA